MSPIIIKIIISLIFLIFPILEVQVQIIQRVFQISAIFQILEPNKIIKTKTTFQTPFKIRIKISLIAMEIITQIIIIKIINSNNLIIAKI